MGAAPRQKGSEFPGTSRSLRNVDATYLATLAGCFTLVPALCRQRGERRSPGLDPTFFAFTAMYSA